VGEGVFVLVVRIPPRQTVGFVSAHSDQPRDRGIRAASQGIVASGWVQHASLAPRGRKYLSIKGYWTAAPRIASGRCRRAYWRYETKTCCRWAGVFPRVTCKGPVRLASSGLSAGRLRSSWLRNVLLSKKKRVFFPHLRQPIRKVTPLA
jgi:hypothetical protein